MPERFLTVTEAKKSFCELVHEADERFDRIIITRDGHPAAVLLAYDDYEEWQETIEVLADAKLMKRIREGMQDEQAGRFVDLDTVKKELSKDASRPTHSARRARPKGASAKRSRALTRSSR